MTIAVVLDADREIPKALRYKVFGMGRKGLAVKMDRVLLWDDHEHNP
jgi:hypothetical protein